MTCVHLFLLYVVYFLYLIYKLDAAPWEFPIDQIKIKKHHSRFCVYLKGEQKSCYDSVIDDFLKNMNDEKKKDFLKSIFHMTYTNDGSKLLNEPGEIPPKQSVENNPHPNNEKGTAAHPLALHIGLNDALGADISSRELLEAERDFYRSLYFRLLKAKDEASTTKPVLTPGAPPTIKHTVNPNDWTMEEEFCCEETGQCGSDTKKVRRTTKKITKATEPPPVTTEDPNNWTMEEYVMCSSGVRDVHGNIIPGECWTGTEKVRRRTTKKITETTKTITKRIRSARRPYIDHIDHA